MDNFKNELLANFQKNMVHVTTSNGYGIRRFDDSSKENLTN